MLVTGEKSVSQKLLKTSFDFHKHSHENKFFTLSRSFNNLAIILGNTNSFNEYVELLLDQSVACFLLIPKLICCPCKNNELTICLLLQLYSI